MQSKKVDYHEGKTISVIIPLFNSEKTINRALNSIEIQNIFNFVEVIIIDDNSGDNSLKRAKSFKFQKNFQKIIIKNNKNMGTGFCRKIGMNIANGFYITFLDADDYWLPNKISNQLSFFESNPNAKIVFSDYSKEQIRNSKKFFFHMKMPKTVSLRINKYINFIPNSSVMVKSELANQITYPIIRKRNDFVYWNFLLSTDKNLLAYNSNPGLPLFVYSSSQGISSDKIKIIPSQWHVYRNIFKYSELSSIKGLLINLIYFIYFYIKIRIYIFSKN